MTTFLIVFKTVCWIVQVCTIFVIVFLAKKIDSKFHRQMELEKKIEERKLNEQSVKLQEGMFLECLLEDENGDNSQTLICVKSRTYNERMKCFVWELYSVSTNQTLYMEKFEDPANARLYFNHENFCVFDIGNAFSSGVFFTVKKVFEQ